jgi:very-short-patch-repair endonuclease
MASGVCGNQRVSNGKVKYARSLRKKMTPAEVLLWDQLRNRRCGGYKFRRQQIVEGFIVDFYCEQSQIVVELDGSIHDIDRVKAHDEHREEVFKTRGIKTIRFRNEEVGADIALVVGQITESCRLNFKPSALTEWDAKRTGPL